MKLNSASFMEYFKLILCSTEQKILNVYTTTTTQYKNMFECVRTHPIIISLPGGIWGPYTYTMLSRFLYSKKHNRKQSAIGLEFNRHSLVYSTRTFRASTIIIDLLLRRRRRCCRVAQNRRQCSTSSYTISSDKGGRIRTGPGGRLEEKVSQPHTLNKIK